jgi:hypothetical protein
MWVWGVALSFGGCAVSNLYVDLLHFFVIFFGGGALFLFSLFYRLWSTRFA